MVNGMSTLPPLRPNFHVPELAKILNKTKQFLDLAHGSSARNEEQYPRKLSGTKFRHSSIFQGYKVFWDKPLEDFLIKLTKVTKKQFFSLHSFPSPTSHKSSRPLLCSAMSVIALPIPEKTFKVRRLQHMEVGPHPMHCLVVI